MRNYIRSHTTHSICRVDNSNIRWKITATETITKESNQIRNIEKNEQMNCSFRLFEIIQKFALKCSLFSAKFSRNLFALVTVFYKRTELKKYTLETEELHCVDVKGWQELTLMGRNKDKNFLCFLSCSRERRG